ncbi:MAG: HEPN domain-containing protein [Candidatus Acidiferrales bacterium]
MNRIDLQSLAELRIREAKLLLESGLYNGAYYLAGYSVECALKACVAKKTKQHDFPDKTLVQRLFTHDLQLLLLKAGLETELSEEMKNNRMLEQNWTIVKGWSEEARYETADLIHYAEDLFSAIMDPDDGVLTWLKKRW